MRVSPTNVSQPRSLGRGAVMINEYRGPGVFIEIGDLMTEAEFFLGRNGWALAQQLR